MNIKQLAEQAGCSEKGLEELEKFIDLERFAELVRLDLYREIGKAVLTQINSAVLMEREACANLCEDEVNQSNSDHEAGGMYWCAEAIRQRGEQP